MSRKHVLLFFLLIWIGVGTALERMPTSAQPQTQQDCPGAPPSRLKVGGSGQVTITPPGQVAIPVRVRSAAGRSGKIIGQITDGTTFTVEEGPVCKDNYAWWRITTDGIEGWVAEGDSSGYFVEPLEAGGQNDNPQPTPTGAVTPLPTLPPIEGGEGASLHFAAFNPGKIDVSGNLQPYQIAPDFNNLVVAAALNADQLDFVQRNGFVVSPGNELEFYTVYEKARYNYQPLFITTDSLLHSFHLVFDKVLRTAESEYFIPLLKDMNKSVLAQADKNYQALKNTDWADAAKRTVAYVSVASKLVDPAAKIPSYVNDVVNQEVANVNNAAGVGPSVIFPELENGEDFTQYIPRGHYIKSDELKAYFRAMMYYGRMTFRLSKPEETKSALVLSLSLRDSNVRGKRGVDAWADLYEPTVFFVGRSDDLSIPQYLQVIDQVYGSGANVQIIQSKPLDAFVNAANALPAPKILGAVIRDTDDIEKGTKGLRFMGQRFVWDAYVFRNLIYRNVGTRDKPRALPMALDVFAALGSERASAILEKEGAPSFENYTSQMQKLRGELSGLSEADWTETLYNSWLYTLNALAQPVPSGYPTFMSNPAYADRSLYAALGSFAELKHDTILYAKQAYAEMGGGGGKSPPPEPVAPPNYVEPLPLFWARLAALAEMTYEGLGRRQLLNPSDADTLQKVAQLARRFQDDSAKELKGEALSDEEQNRLRFYGGDLEQILAATADEYNKDAPPNAFENQPQAAVIADIASSVGAGNTKEQKVLEIGVGRVFDMYAAVPVNGKLWLAHGAVFSYYEFEHPLNDRLTDEKWQQMLDQGKAPPVPGWTFSFMSKTTVDSELSAAVRNFQNYLNGILWDDPVASYEQFRQQSSDKAAKFLVTQLEPLAKAHQYEGRQIIETSFRSFDMQDAKTAVVTTRETWRGELHNYGPDAFSDGPKIAERGPYTIDVTYTLTKDQNGFWSVSNVVVNGTLPPWNKAAS